MGANSQKKKIPHQSQLGLSLLDIEIAKRIPSEYYQEYICLNCL